MVAVGIGVECDQHRLGSINTTEQISCPRSFNLAVWPREGHLPSLVCLFFFEMANIILL